MTASPASSRRIFLLSPARCDGERMGLLLRAGGSFPLAWKLQHGGLSVGEAFQFASGLYFRGKRAYAERFAAPPPGMFGAWVISQAEGLVDVNRIITVEDLRRWAKVDIDAGNARFTEPLVATACALEKTGGPVEVVLLGSIASNKYADVLLEIFGDRLLFPLEFVGRGDMSRGGLMLRCVRAETELVYGPVLGAVRRGKRPPKLAPMR